MSSESTQSLLVCAVWPGSTCESAGSDCEDGLRFVEQVLNVMGRGRRRHCTAGPLNDMFRVCMI